MNGTRSTGETDAREPAGPADRRWVVRAVARTVGLNVLLPTVVFFLLRGRVADDAVALAVAGALPVGRTVLAVVRGRAVEPLAALTGAGFAVSLVVYLLTGGNPVAIELHEAVLTGSLGLGALLAVALGFRVDRALVRLAPPAVRQRLRDRGESRPGDGDLAARRRATVVTVIVGATLLVHALALLGIALSVPVAQFVLLSRAVGLPVLGAGLGAAALYGYRAGSGRDARRGSTRPVQHRTEGEAR